MLFCLHDQVLLISPTITLSPCKVQPSSALVTFSFAFFTPKLCQVISRPFPTYFHIGLDCFLKPYSPL